MTTNGSESGVATHWHGLRVDDLHKSFGQTDVLRGVSIEVPTGDVVALIGPSGSGKSTLLKCINLLEKADSGTVELDGLRLGWKQGSKAAIRASARELAEVRRTIGMVFQSFNLFPHLTLLENTVIGQVRALGRSRSEAAARGNELLARVGLSAKKDDYPNQCSGGQQQRCAIARALALKPRVMLFDEPTSSLDPELGLEVLEVMRELARDGMTMVVATHEMHFAEDVADQVVFMADGRVVENGPPSRVLRQPVDDRTRRFLKAVLER